MLMVVSCASCNNKSLSNDDAPLVSQPPKHSVRVLDSVTGRPIHKAKVTSIYPSFNGTTYLTNTEGVAQIKGFGVPGPGGVGVSVEAPGYKPVLHPTYRNGGEWKEEDTRLEIHLQPEKVSANPN
ncbi:MAG: hypothetical protein AAGA25_16475 [Planctomycetota bacterium]